MVWIWCEIWFCREFHGLDHFLDRCGIAFAGCFRVWGGMADSGMLVLLNVSGFGVVSLILLCCFCWVFQGLGWFGRFWGAVFAGCFRVWGGLAKLRVLFLLGVSWFGEVWQILGCLFLLGVSGFGVVSADPLFGDFLVSDVGLG